jgi:hypothetical protein
MSTLTCKNCNGTGLVTCPKCAGTAKVDGEKCPRCARIVDNPGHINCQGCGGHGYIIQ